MYQALYRKWRPKVFSEVVGQEHITDTLRRQVAEGHTAHAYLFTGTRGTGKTTCARILAKAVNCLSPVDGEPCGRCEACRAVDAGTTLDITELDASNLDLVSISAIGEFDALERVNLSGNRISNIYIFQWLSGIKEINLEGNQVSDVSPLLSMESLEVLDLTDNCVSSTSALCQMTWLKELHIAGNDLTAEQIDELRQSLPNTTIYAD